MTDSIAEMAKMHASPTTEITTISPKWGPRSIEGHFEESIAALATIETVAMYKDEYDAFVIACYGDPAVAACREITDKPVIGIGEASMHMACFLGHQFSINLGGMHSMGMYADLDARNLAPIIHGHRGAR